MFRIVLLLTVGLGRRVRMFQRLVSPFPGRVRVRSHLWGLFSPSWALIWALTLLSDWQVAAFGMLPQTAHCQIC